MVETNTFGGSPITLGEFGLSDRAEEINRRAAEIAREAAELFAGDGRERFILGSVGPGTRLPSLGHVAYDALEAAFRSEEHTSELQSLMRISYAVFCLKKKNKNHTTHSHYQVPTQT